MTSSITEYTNESLRQISEPECFINMPDHQAYKSERHIPPCVNEFKVVVKDEKEASTALAESTPV